MKSLNEKLAEVCGKSCEVKGNDVYIMQPYRVRDNVFGYKEVKWNPTTDLNQLRECYLAAEKDCKLSFPHISFAHKFKDAVDELFTDMTEYPAVPSELATMWIVYPDLVAQAILKAKGVE